MQQTMLIVRVGNDVRFFNNGRVPFANVSVAENQYFKDKETGERKQYTTWIPVIGYGRKAELMRDYLKKGNCIGISGTWKNLVYERDGKKQYQLALRLKDVHFCNSKVTSEHEMDNKSEDGEFIHIEPQNQPFGSDFTMPSYIPGLDDEE